MCNKSQAALSMTTCVHSVTRYMYVFVKLLPGKHTHADCTSTFTALVHNFNQQPGHSYIYIHVYLALSGFFAGRGTSQKFEVIILCNIRVGRLSM